MKKIIKDVLSDMSESQINLGSESAREMIASLVSAALKTKGEYTKHTNDNLEEQEARKTWVCSICGKNTYDIDWDYIGSGTNHLSCEVRLELDEEYREKNWSQKKHEEKVFDEYAEDIDEQAFAQGRGSSKDVRREKTWSQKKHEDKVFGNVQKQIYSEMTSDGLPEGGDTQAVLESHKLAEEIVDNKDEKWIYESPDGGKTVFRRPFSDYNPENKEEIDWETKEPTGRIFTDYPFKEKGNER